MTRRSLAEDEYGYLMTVAEFKSTCAEGGFIDYDGYGYLVFSDQVEVPSLGEAVVLPSEREKIPADATHILWFNR